MLSTPVIAMIEGMRRMKRVKEHQAGAHPKQEQAATTMTRRDRLYDALDRAMALVLKLLFP
jgi:hypothetical protein